LSYLRSRLAGERGQALVELVACLPVIVLVVLGIVQGMLALGASGSAERALERGRLAAASGLDPVAAARDGLSHNARVQLEGRTLRVSVPVPRMVPGISLPPVGASALLVG
jgi:Flp pilus assembly protein TadG